MRFLGDTSRAQRGPASWRYPTGPYGGTRTKGELGEPRAKAPKWRDLLKEEALSQFLQGDWSFPWEEWAVQGPDGWQLPAGWSQCAWSASQACHDAWMPVDRGWWTNAGCFAGGTCPTNQNAGVEGSTNLPWGTVHASRLFVVALHKTALGKGTLLDAFARTDAGVTTMPEFVAARAIPLALPQPQTLPEGGTSGGAGSSGSWAPMQSPKPDPWLKPELDDGRDPLAPYKRKARERSLPASRGRRPPPTRTVFHKDVPDKVRKPLPRVPKWLLRVINAFHSATEFADFVNAVYDGMGLSGQRSLAAKFAAIVANLALLGDVIVAAQVIRNLVANEIEDRIIGRLFGAQWKNVSPGIWRHRNADFLGAPRGVAVMQGM